MEFRLKAIRKAQGITQTALATELGMSQNSISRYENMLRQCDYNTLTRLADYFDVSIDYLLGRTDKPELNK